MQSSFLFQNQAPFSFFAQGMVPKPFVVMAKNPLPLVVPKPLPLLPIPELAPHQLTQTFPIDILFMEPKHRSLELPSPLPLPLSRLLPPPPMSSPNDLPPQKTDIFEFQKSPPPTKDDSIYPFSNVLPYSGNYTGTLAKIIDLYDVTPMLLSAVESKTIRGMRYFDATTRKQVSAGHVSKNEKKIKNKKMYKTKRRRLDFDHQISIFWKKGVHVKLFKTGKMLIPACGSEQLAKDAFELIAKICNTKVKSFTCNNQNLRLVFPKSIHTNLFFNWMKENGFEPTRTKTGRIKIRMWWNNNYYNACKCRCCPKHCSTIPKNKRGFEHIEGKCTPSTVLFGKKSATIFGTSFKNQRGNIVWTLRQMIEAFEHGGGPARIQNSWTGRS